MPVPTYKPSGMPESEWNKIKKENNNYAEQISNAVETNPIPVTVPEVKQKETPTPVKINTDQYKKSAVNEIAGIGAKPKGYSEAIAEQQGGEEAKMNTGSGIESAIGTKENPINYSWEDKAAKLAEKTYSQKVLEEKQNLLTNRQELEKNSQQYQTQADMQKYVDNQTADKVGWTGGYVLDQNQQREYLKASIQAQLYGAMELQKYGYETSLAAARLAYDSNMLQYAEEYYNQAVQNSLNEAQVTGTYFSAEVKDMLGQWKVAEQKLTENPNDAQANQVKESIIKWFKTNNISDAGIKTLEAWNAEQSMELQWQQELWTQYNAAYESINADVKDTPTTFIRVDETGKTVYENSTVQTIDMTQMSDSDLASYASIGKDACKQVQSYFKILIEDIKNQNTTIKEDGTKTYNTQQINKEYEKLLERVEKINSALKDKKINLGITVPKNNSILESEEEAKDFVKNYNFESEGAPSDDYIETLAQYSKNLNKEQIKKAFEDMNRLQSNVMFKDIMKQNPNAKDELTAEMIAYIFDGKNIFNKQ